MFGQIGKFFSNLKTKSANETRVPSQAELIRTQNFNNHLFWLSFNNDQIDSIYNNITQRYQIAKKHTVVSKAISYLQNKLTHVNIVLKQTKGTEISQIDSGNPVIDLIGNPKGFFDKTESSLLRKMFFEYFLNGEVFLLYDRFAESLEVIPKDLISITAYTLQRLPTKITITSFPNTTGSNTLNFAINENQVYFDCITQGGEDLILYRAYQTNNFLLDGNECALQSIFMQNAYNIQIFTNIQASLYAISSRAINTGIITLENAGELNTIGDDFYKNTSQGLQNKLETSTSSGYTMLTNVNGQKLNFQILNEFKYAELKMALDDQEERLLKGFGLSRADFEITEQKFSNMAQSKTKVYTDTILPIVTFLCENLQFFLFEVFGVDNKTYKIDYDITQVPEFKEAEFDIAVKMTNIGVFTRNEIRNKLGYLPLPDESGDELTGTPKNNNSLADVIG